MAAPIILMRRTSIPPYCVKYFSRQYRDFYRYHRVKMSHDYGAFPASGTKIAYLGHTKQNVAFFAFLHGRVYALFRYGSAPPVSIRILSQLPSFRLPITRVSAQLICGILSHGINSCRLLAHFLSGLLTVRFPQQHLVVDVFLLLPAFLATTALLPSQLPSTGCQLSGSRQP